MKEMLKKGAEFCLLMTAYSVSMPGVEIAIQNFYVVIPGLFLIALGVYWGGLPFCGGDAVV